MTTHRPEFTTKTFWLNTSERVVRTGAQTALAVGVTDGVTDLHLDWQQGALTVGLAMVASLLMALAGKAVGDPDSPSYVLPAPRRGAAR
jgi:hypothetical protein